MQRLAPLAALALAGCVTSGTSATPGLGQVGLVDSVRVRPVQVVEDSRCPINAICVWAGRLVVRTQIRVGGWQETRDLELRRPEHVPGGQLTLVEASPSKLADQPIEPRDYRFTFAFERL